MLSVRLAGKSMNINQRTSVMCAHLFQLSPGGSCLVLLYPGLAQQVEKEADEEGVSAAVAEEEEEVEEGGQDEER